MASAWGGKPAFVLLLVLSSMTLANAINESLINWNYHWPISHQNSTQTKKIIVGGTEGWRFGFNYTAWAHNDGPFHLGDTLVFKYDPPNATTFAHSVYLLANHRSFVKCDLRLARKIADVNEGGGDGFQFVLNKWQTYYFACGGHNGFHCNNGTMKFVVVPLIPV